MAEVLIFCSWKGYCPEHLKHSLGLDWQLKLSAHVTRASKAFWCSTKPLECRLLLLCWRFTFYYGASVTVRAPEMLSGDSEALKFFFIFLLWTVLPVIKQPFSFVLSKEGRLYDLFHDTKSIGCCFNCVVCIRKGLLAVCTRFVLKFLSPFNPFYCSCHTGFIACYMFHLNPFATKFLTNYVIVSVVSRFYRLLFQ